jgi:trehalose/maltose transport system substrate-binding protein
MGISALLALVLPAAPARAQVTVTVACSALGIEAELCREGAETWSKETGNAVRFVAPPKSASDRLALYQQLLAARSEDIDVFQIDVVWPGILGAYLVDLSKHVDAAEVGLHLPALVDAATVAGRLVAMPWFADAGILYYREDLLEKYGRAVPETWADLQETARLIQEGERGKGNDRMWGFVWQGRAYEGLTVNALEWIDSFRGGSIVSRDGEITVNNPRAAEALGMAASWVGAITPTGVLNYSEEEARGVFQSGNAVFMRNWPYAWPLLNAEDSPVKGKVGVTPIPSGGADGKRTATLGGAMLAVNRFSPRGEAAIDLVKHLTSAEEQKRRAVEGGFNPTVVSLYEDAEVVKANPFFEEMRETVANGVVRPAQATRMRYNQVSNEFWNAVHETLSGQEPAAEALAELERTLERVSRGGRW